MYNSCTALTYTWNFLKISEQYQVVDTNTTTTVKKELKKRPLSFFGIDRLSFVSPYRCLHWVFNIYPDNGATAPGMSTCPRRYGDVLSLMESPPVNWTIKRTRS
jgi:hypothetical protein